MKIRNLDLTSSPLNEEHRQLGLPPLEEAVSHPGWQPFLHAAVWFTSLTLAALGVFLMGRLFLPNNWVGGMQIIRETLNGGVFWSAAAVGLVAQMVDGALGMAYGATATTFLLATGAGPAAASASVHIAEIFTTGVSGISHTRLGNVNKQLFVRLLVPGILGAILGAILVTYVDGAAFKPFMSAYLLVLGVYILSKSFRELRPRSHEPRHVGKLALFGGFIDAAGGGGWGPVVTTTLIGSGNDPRTTIGSVNFAEFFLTLTSAATFSLLMSTSAWAIIAGLVFGGLFAAPFAALLCKKLPARTLLVIVGALISFLSASNLYQALAR
jgi:uncharacterized membrane protein YfcA